MGVKTRKADAMTGLEPEIMFGEEKLLRMHDQSRVYTHFVKLWGTMCAYVCILFAFMQFLAQRNTYVCVYIYVCIAREREREREREVCVFLYLCSKAKG